MIHAPLTFRELIPRLFGIFAFGLCVLPLSSAQAQIELRLVARDDSKPTNHLAFPPSTFRPGQSSDMLDVERTVLLSGADIDSIGLEGGANDGSGDQKNIAIHFNESGAKKLEEVTRKNPRRRLAIIINGKPRVAPVIVEPITMGSIRIAGAFSPEEKESLVKEARAALHQ